MHCSKLPSGGMGRGSTAWLCILASSLTLSHLSSPQNLGRVVGTLQEARESEHRVPFRLRGRGLPQAMAMAGCQVGRLLGQVPEPGCAGLTWLSVGPWAFCGPVPGTSQSLDVIQPVPFASGPL